MISISASLSFFALALCSAAAPIPVPDAVNFSDITTPSQGGSFTDFQSSTGSPLITREPQPGLAEVIGSDSRKRGIDTSLSNDNKAGLEVNFDENGGYFKRELSEGALEVNFDENGGFFKRQLSEGELGSGALEVNFDENGGFFKRQLSEDLGGFNSDKLEVNFNPNDFHFKRQLPEGEFNSDKLDVNFNPNDFHFKRQDSDDSDGSSEPTGPTASEAFVPPIDVGSLEVNLNSNNIFKRETDGLPHNIVHRRGKDILANYDGSHFKR